jgi:hypothetical protein
MGWMIAYVMPLAAVPNMASMAVHLVGSITEPRPTAETACWFMPRLARPGPPRPAASQPSSSSWTPSISSESLGIGIETEFLIQAREPLPESDTLKLFARDMSREYNRRDEISKGVGPSMESLIGNLTNLDKETHMTWRLVHDPTVETQSAPCKTKFFPYILIFYSYSADNGNFFRRTFANI